MTLSDGTDLYPYLACSSCEGFCDVQSYNNKNDVLTAWSYIGKNGLHKTLQGFYGRTLRNLIQEGLLDDEFNVVQQ